MRGFWIIILFLGLIVCIYFIAYFTRIEIREDDIYTYEGVDCYISFNETRLLSNISEIMEKNDFSYRIWFKRSSPAGTGEIIDNIDFSFNYSSSKNISGQIFNFNTANLTIKLHYYPDDHPELFKSHRTNEEAQNSSYSRYLEEKEIFEDDVEYIISIFNSEFNSNPQSVEYSQLIVHSVLG